MANLSNSDQFLVATGWDATLAGSIYGITGMALALCDSFLAILLQKLRPLDEHFGLLYNSCVLMECCNLVLLACWCGPIVARQDYAIGRSSFGKRIGHFAVFIWNVIVFITIAIAANRCAAMRNPLEYRSKFTRKRAWYVLAGCFVMAFIYTSPFFIPDFDFYVDPDHLGWVFSGSHAWWHCTVACSLAFITLFGINLSALKAMRNMKKAIEPVLFTTTAVAPTNSQFISHSDFHFKLNPKSITKIKTFEQNEQKQREIRFFFQAVANTFCFEGMIISYHLISPFFPTAWGYFLLANYPLLIAHGTNGLVNFYSNFHIFDGHYQQRVPQRSVQLDQEDVCEMLVLMSREASSMTV